MEVAKYYNDFLKELLRFKRENSPSYTNFYLMGNRLKSLIEQTRISYEIIDNCLVVTEDQGEYNHFYYCVNADVAIPVLKSDKINVAYLVYNQSVAEKDIETQRNKLLYAGFEYRIKSLTYETKIGECADVIHNNLAVQSQKAKKNCMELRYMRQEDYQEVDDLFRKCFDMLRVPYICKEFNEIVRDKRGVIAYKKTQMENGKVRMKIIGIMLVDFNGKTIHTQKICVHPECRGMGVGRYMMLAVLAEAVELGYKRWLVEIDEDNYSSKKMHFGALDYIPKESGVVAEMYVKHVD